MGMPAAINAAQATSAADSWIQALKSKAPTGKTKRDGALSNAGVASGDD